ncbi:hypothetical protein [Kutzneria buriramensis]|uniref:Uncharacterized protein n=1 Tax=Kutzneria buriramensis TaxID=1045776 RepID=A0A3E0HGB4_9PSEU|nr:hypothetical protein [Kutzneria buriramensis]REH44860.1 hypothetical protein BCF44_108341 [Kutzneria buriramensis]
MASQPLTFAPGDDPIGRVREFIGNPALRALVEQFGGSWPAGELPEILRALVEFSAVWDQRRGAGRLDIQDDADFDRERAMAAVEQLGLRDPAPPQESRYDWVLVLGGLAAGCRRRTMYLVRLLVEGAIETAGVCMLGSFRDLRTDELTATTRFATSATTEVDLLLELATREFRSERAWTIQVDGDRTATPRLAQLHAWRVGKPELHVFAALSSQPERRAANTADTYEQAARTLMFPPKTRLLVVTTHLYALYQHFDAVRVLGLPHQLSVETVGTPPEARGRTWSTTWYLQEVRSALRAGLLLVTAAESRRPPR